MKKKIPSLIIGICAMAFLQAQSLSQHVIPSEGGTAIGGQISLDWTLGELSAESIFTGQNIYTEGFHQPILKVEIVEKITDGPLTSQDLDNDLHEIKVYPNPVNAQLTIDFDEPQDSGIQVSLTDVNGRQFDHQIVRPGDQSLQFDMAQQADGLYLLHFRKSSGEIIASYKIIKSH